MRKITLDAYKAFINARNWKKSNTEVYFEKKQSKLYLFKNLIAIKDCDGRIKITDAGWKTQCTQERLRMFDIILRREKGMWIVNEKEEWDGKWKYIDEFKY